MHQSQSSPLARELHKQGPFTSLQQEAFLSILRTASTLTPDFDRLFKAHNLSSATYNVLRILRGSGEQGRNCTQIGQHLVAAVPDITRLIDRLESAGLVKRHRQASDRRVVVVHITTAGLALLKKLDAPTVELHRQQLGHMADADLQALCDLLAKARQSFHPPTPAD